MPINVEKIVQQIGIDGAEKIKSDLKALGTEGEAAFKKMERGLNNIKTDNLIKGLTEAKKGTVNLGETVKDIAGNVVSSFNLIVASATVAVTAIVGVGTALFGIAKSAANAADAIRDGAIQTGQATASYQRLTHAFELSGGKAENFNRSINALNDAIGDAQAKGEKSSGAFKQLGIDLIGAAGRARPAEEILKDIADRFERLPEPADRAALAIQLFGRRAGPQLVELLSEGRAGIEALGKDAEKLGVILSADQLRIGDKMNDSLTRLGATVSALRTKFGLLFAPIVTELADKLANSIASLHERALALGTQIADFLKPIIDDLVLALTGDTDKIQNSFIFAVVKGISALGTALQTAFAIVQPIIAAIGELFVFLADIINKAFGTKITGLELFLIVLGLIAVAFAGLPTLIVLAATAIGFLIQQLTKVGGVFDQIKEFAVSLWNDLTSTFQAGVDRLISFFTRLRDFVVDVWNAITGAAREAAVAQNEAVASGGGGQGFAHGGAVYGPGTGTSDSIVARLSSGEYVIRAAAVRKYGLRLFNAINKMRFPIEALRGFANGGLADTMTPLMARPIVRMAEGGLVDRPRNVLNLTIDQQQFEGLLAQDDVADRLVRFARQRNILSAGKKPGYYGGGK